MKELKITKILTIVILAITIAATTAAIALLSATIAADSNVLRVKRRRSS
jgi:hypothetical protein